MTRAVATAAGTVWGFRRVRQGVVIVAVLIAVALTLWRFLPRTLLPPKDAGTILNRATAGTWVTFNDGAPGQRTLLLSTGPDLWSIPSGKSLEPGINVGQALSPDGTTFLLGDNLTLLDWRTRLGIQLEDPAPQWLSYTTGGGVQNRFTGPVQFSNDGKWVAASRPNGSLYLLDAATGKIAHALREGGNVFTPYNGTVGTCNATSLAFSRDDRLLASGELNGEITLWNTHTGDLVKTLQQGTDQPCQATVPQEFDPSAQISGLGFSPGGRLVASDDSYGVIRLWDVRSGKLVRALPLTPFGTFGQVAFSPDGRFLVAAGRSANAAEEVYLVWDAETGRLLRALSSPGSGAFDFSPSGDLITAQLDDGRVKVEKWTLRSRFRLPFASSAASSVAPSDPGTIKAYEAGAMENLSVLETALAKYMDLIGSGGFPASLEEISKHIVENKGMLGGRLYGYRFVYTPGQADASGHITSFVLSARPLLYEQTGVRSFRVDQTGQAYATDEDREATTTDSVVNGLRSAMQMVQLWRNEAHQQAAAHVARAQTLFQQRQFQAAIAECDAALNIDPANQDASKLKSQIQQTMSILGVR